MADSDWEFDVRPGVKRFRDARTGRFLSTDKAVDLRDGFQERRRADLLKLSGRLADQEITVQQWEDEMRALVRQIHAAEYIYGRGGLNAMKDGDWEAIDRLAAEQWAFVRKFADQIAAGRLSESEINTRAKLYFGASRQAYERGRAAAFGLVLPAYPGQGTECQANCACWWSITETEDEYRATWRRSASESCATCKQRSQTWAPLVIAKTDTGRMARLWRMVA